MSKLKYALAMLGVGGAAAMGTEADASTIVNLNLSPYDSPVDITLFDGGPAQFYYGAGTAKVAPVTFGPAAVFGTYGSATAALSGNPQTSGEVKVGILDHTDPADPTSPLTYTQFPFVADTYLDLTFDHGGDHYTGTAFVDTSGYLRSIEYDLAAAAVPEPASWALLIGGLGLTGAALRRRRQAAEAA
jgi:hypothetical protein